MNYKIIIFVLFLLLNSCANQTIKKEPQNKISGNLFSSKGFALVYNKNLYKNKILKSKIENRSLIIFQKNLKKDTIVKVTNLNNSKYLLAKVGKNTNYPNFYNSVVSDRIKKELLIDENDPYVEIKEINDSNSFIAKKAKMFDEEKKVATKVPVDDVKIKDLSNNKPKITKSAKKKFSYIILIGDFYFLKSATNMQKRIVSETAIEKVHIKKISSTEFRVFLGPFDNLNSLKKSFNAINILEFDNLEIIRQ